MSTARKYMVLVRFLNAAERTIELEAESASAALMAGARILDGEGHTSASVTRLWVERVGT